jgi:hypothetical protein
MSNIFEATYHHKLQFNSKDYLLSSHGHLFHTCFLSQSARDEELPRTSAMAGKEFVASSGEDGFRPYHGAAADEIASGRPLPIAGKMASARITGSPPTSSRRGGRHRARIGGAAAAEREMVWSSDRARRRRCMGRGGGSASWGAVAMLHGERRRRC